MTGSSVAMPSSDHVRDKRRRRRDEILHAALTAFRETGYHSTTLADIADRLGIRKTALYHYFPDKEAILFECHRQSLAELERLTTEAQELDSAVDRLHFIIREHVRVMTDTLEGSPLAFEVTSMSEERQAEIIEGRDRYEQELRSTIAAGILAGEFRQVDPKIATFAILGSINWIARWYRPEGELRADELGTEFANLLVGGLTCSPPGEAR
jgi:AcrR family transcriptional regulator